MRPTSIATVLLLIALNSGFYPRAHADVLVATGSTWKYLDDGSDQGTAWRAPSFSDSTWSSGAAQLGYGDGDEATVLSYGTDANNKYVTTYFRHAFSVTDPSVYLSATLDVLRDDGAVAYLNGVEIFRGNMPGGNVSASTWASVAIGGADETTFFSAGVDPALLVAGVNVLAVEVHQANGTSSDISFDLQLTASTTVNVTRGPYLQVGTPSSIHVRWRTDAPAESYVRYGLAPDNLDHLAGDAALTTEHEVVLTGLSADTEYFYSVGTSTATLAGGSDYVFFTSPPAGTSFPTRIWVIGDAGTGTADQMAVRDAYYNFTGTRYTDVWLMLGDNVYESGTDPEYQTRLFEIYPTLLRKSVCWPAVGNHDTAQSSNPPDTIPYFLNFSMPVNGEAGGLASGTKKYYSFDFGEIHFVCLDSMTSSRQPGSAMLTWLSADLSSTTAKWLIAYWHHPPYSKGHDSDTDTIETEMRQNVVPILEQNGVDLVLSGHTHAYERSYLLDGHYGVSSTLTSDMILDGGSGREDGDGAYIKPTYGLAPHEGAVYAVAGSSGKIGSYALNHPAMYISLARLGSMVIDVNGNRLDAKFLRDNGAIDDYFSIIKSTPANNPPPVAITSPADGASFTQPADITITADAQDSDGSIAQVNFYAGSVRIGTATASPYSYTWANVSPGQYTLTANAVDDLGATTASAPVNITVVAAAPPQEPANLTATAVSSSEIDLRWDDQAQYEDGFRIERSTDGASFSVIATLPANSSSYADQGLSALTTYYYRVQAYNNAGDSAYSNTAIDTTPTSTVDVVASGEITVAGTVSGTYTDTWSDDGTTETLTERTSGGKPQSRYSYLEHKWLFNVGSGNSATVFLNAWADTSADGDSYWVAWSPDDTAYYDIFMVTKTSDVGEDQTVDLPMTAQGTIYIRVRDADRTPGNNNLDSLHVDHLFIRTSPRPPGLPVAPNNLSATASSETQVNLAWTDNATDEAGFYIERSSDGANFTQIGSVGANATGYSDIGVQAANSYDYRVRAFNTVGQSGYSNVATVTTPGGIVLSATGYKVKGEQTVDLSWTEATSVVVYRDGLPIATVTNGTTYTDSIGQKGAGGYTYQVVSTADNQPSNQVLVVF